MLTIPNFIKQNINLSNTLKYNFLAGVCFYLVLFSTYIIYSEGLTSGTQFDDKANLQDLIKVNNFASIIDFTFNGIVGRFKFIYIALIPLIYVNFNDLQE